MPKILQEYERFFLIRAFAIEWVGWLAFFAVEAWGKGRALRSCLAHLARQRGDRALWPNHNSSGTSSDADYSAFLSARALLAAYSTVQVQRCLCINTALPAFPALPALPSVPARPMILRVFKLKYEYNPIRSHFIL